RPVPAPARVAGLRLPDTGRAGRRAGVVCVVCLVMGEPWMEFLDPATRAACHIVLVASGALAGVPVPVRECRPIVLADRVGLDEYEVPVGLGVARHPEREVATRLSGQIDRPGESLVSDIC